MATPITASGTSRDRQGKSFVNSPTRGENFSAQEVFVGNGLTNPVPIIDFRGPTKFIANEILISEGATLVIASKVVPAGTIVSILSVSVSGENKGVFTLEVNNSVAETFRTYYTKFNEKMFCNDLELVETDTVEVKCTNTGEGAALFNATIYYKEYDES